MRAQSKLPAALGYRMPAEWEPHASTWLAWPHFRGDWPGKFEPIPWVYAEIIRNLSRHERVNLVVQSEGEEKRVRGFLERADAVSENISFHRWRTDRVWTRDSGCIFLTAPEGATHFEALAASLKRSPDIKVNISANCEAVSFPNPARAPFPKPVRKASVHAKNDGSPLALHFQFNAWAKYDNYKHDAKLGERMATAVGARVVRPLHGEEHVVLEGGSIDVNGRGTLLTTEECLLSTTQQRNPSMNRAAYEQMFADYFGVQKVIWLAEGIEGDDTHGHVDDITRFVSANTVITMIEPDAQRANYSDLHHNLGRLKAARDQDGERLNIVEIPMPRPVVFEGRLLPASYANFYIANGIVLVPVFNDPNDRIALNTLAGLFPDREIVPIYSGDLIWGFGALHCMTQQEPVVSSQ
jgi:agmatine deiminase